MEGMEHEGESDMEEEELDNEEEDKKKEEETKTHEITDKEAKFVEDIQNRLKVQVLPIL